MIIFVQCVDAPIELVMILHQPSESYSSTHEYVLINPNHANFSNMYIDFGVVAGASGGAARRHLPQRQV
jgi:hypothetical protein